MKSKIQKIKFILIIPVFLMIYSCVSFSNSIQKNHSKSLKLFKTLYNKNGNAFLIGPKEGDFTFLWSFTSDSKLNTYEMKKGKIINEEEFDFKKEDFSEIYDIEKEITWDEIGCIVLGGGDIMIYKIKNKKNETMEDDFFIGIDCFTKKKTDNFLLSNIRGVITNYLSEKESFKLWMKHINSADWFDYPQ